MNLLKISVIIPVYNADKYLKKCLDSIVNQTYSNLEIILINDGSTDGSKEICEKYAKMDKRIIFLDQSNHGLSYTRNRGIENATGEYISFIDSDDYVEETLYENAYKTIIYEKPDIIQFGHCTVSEEGQILDKYEYKYEIINSGYDALIQYIKFNKLKAILCNKIFKKDLFENIRLIEGRNHEDLMIIGSLYEKSKKIILIEGLYYYYVMTKGSIVRGVINQKKLDDAIFAMNYIENFYSKNYPELSKYSSSMLCKFSSKTYYDLIKSCNKKLINIYDSKVYNIFKNNYILILDNKLLSRKLKLLFKILYFNKTLYIFLLGIYNKYN